MAIHIFLLELLVSIGLSHRIDIVSKPHEITFLLYFVGHVVLDTFKKSTCIVTMLEYKSSNRADACRAMLWSAEIVDGGLADAGLWILEVETPWEVRVVLMAELMIGRMTTVLGWASCSKEIKQTLCCYQDVIFFLGKLHSGSVLTLAILLRN